jgi:hypothetical protein
MTRLALLSIAIALGLAGWIAIVAGLGWWVAGALAYLYLLLITATWSIGGVTAALLWLERRRRG